MRLRSDQGGFIFSLDATLAVVVTLIVFAGVARVGSPGAIYEQHGYLRLERYADDALIVMYHMGTITEIVELIDAGENDLARQLARETLRKILPKEVQFKLVIGGEGEWLDNVYPGTDTQTWVNAFNQAEEIAVASIITPETVRVVEKLDVLAWCDDPKEIDFTESIMKPGWRLEITSDQKEFVAYLENDIKPDFYPDVVFLPDVDESWDSRTKCALWRFNCIAIDEAGEDIGGGVVAGGATLWNNRLEIWGRLMVSIFGVDPWGPMKKVDPSKEFAPEKNNMRIIDTNHYITSVFEENEKIPYAGDAYPQYKYTLFSGPFFGDRVRTLGEWEVEGETWPGLIARRAIFEGWGKFTFGERTVLFNTHLAQSAEDGVGTKQWKTLAQRALEWASRETPELEPVTLYVWRGPEVGE